MSPTLGTAALGEGHPLANRRTAVCRPVPVSSRRRDRLRETISSRPWVGAGSVLVGVCAFAAAAFSIYGDATGAKASAAVSGNLRGNVIGGLSQQDPALRRASLVGTEIQPLRIYGRVDIDLRTAMQAIGVPDPQIDQYVKIISREVSPDTIGPGDHFDIVLRQKLDADTQPELGSVMYAGLYRTDGVNVRLAEWRLGGRTSWFDADEVGRTYQAIQRPVPGVVSSNFGPRHHPILGYTRMHKGMDFKAGYGTPILAVQTGYVQVAGWNSGGFGNHVELLHGAGLQTTYSHMSGILVRPGQLVQQGQVIGYVGATGLATGPHLHYELHRYGRAIDPSTVQFTASSQLMGRDLIGYRTRVGQMLSLPFGRSPERPWLS